MGMGSPIFSLDDLGLLVAAVVGLAAVLLAVGVWAVRRR